MSKRLDVFLKDRYLFKKDGHLFLDTSLCNKMHEDAAKVRWCRILEAM